MHPAILGLFHDSIHEAPPHLSPGQETGVSDVEAVPGLLKRHAASLGLLNTLLAQRGVEPATELVGLVPLGLSVPDTSRHVLLLICRFT